MLTIMNVVQLFIIHSDIHNTVTWKLCLNSVAECAFFTSFNFSLLVDISKISVQLNINMIRHIQRAVKNWCIPGLVYCMNQKIINKKRNLINSPRLSLRLINRL